MERGETEREPWTTTHGFFAAMGGFAFDASGADQNTSGAEHNFLPRGRTRVTLSSSGVCFLAEEYPDLLPNIPKDYISGKSKSDALAKTLVCLQAIWFCTQCISRVAAGLSISLLELNTFAHALFALCAFVFWWKKPQDVVEPILIQGPAMRKICAAMWMTSHMSSVNTVERYDGSRGKSAPVVRVLDLQDASAGSTTREPLDLLLETPVKCPTFSDIVPDGTQGIAAFSALEQRQVA